MGRKATKLAPLKKETSQAAQLLHAADRWGELMLSEEQKEADELVTEQEEESKKKASGSGCLVKGKNGESDVSKQSV